MDNKVYFVGAGPGNPKLITVMGRELLESADLVVYAGSLVNPEVLDYSNGEKIDSYGLTLDKITSIMAENVKAGKKVVRLHSGDPSLYGAIVEQIDELEKHGIGVELVPGVSSIFASAAALKTQLTLNGISDTLIITRPAGETLENDLIKELSKHNATMAVFLGTQKIEDIMNRIEYSPDTPVAVVFHASWDDQQIIRGNVSDIAQKVKDAGIKRSAMIIIGGVVDPKNYRRSHLYGVAQEPL
ncbi:MAG: precorrin-4 C(11)-methyltransferase [Methanosarcinaceae archaeon]|nr:precorrin-4 C(11)-methyltransferase [Methanosarcinaceae archaeon]